MLLQAFAFQLLHHNEGMAVVIFDFVDGADRGMIQQGGGPGFALEALHGLAVAGQVVGEKFYGNVAAQPGVFCLVNHSHPAAAELAQNSVVGDRLADHGDPARTLARRSAVHSEAKPL